MVLHQPKAQACLEGGHQTQPSSFSPQPLGTSGHYRTSPQSQPFPRTLWLRTPERGVGGRHWYMDREVWGTVNCPTLTGQSAGPQVTKKSKAELVLLVY